MPHLSDLKTPETLGQWQQTRLSLSRAQLLFLSKELEQAVLLDGSEKVLAHSYLIFTALPSHTVQFDDSGTTPQHTLRARNNPAPENITRLPFMSGYVGYLAYDYGQKQHGGKDSVRPQPELPASHIGYYDWSYVYDLKERTGYLTFSPSAHHSTRLRIVEAIRMSQSSYTVSAKAAEQSWFKSQSRETYRTAFDKLHSYILAGDIYQANLTQRFESELEGHIADYYFAMRKKSSAPYSALLCINRQQHILSFSPEQFIEVNNQNIISKPIKGTISADTPDAIMHLKNSTKDRAENLMIVDLLRNDLSRVSMLNSVTVPKLFDIERHRDVYHMVSTIQGRLTPATTPFEALLSCFPGGSITGAPKKRAMEIINELECTPRSAYCGSIFYWSDEGNLDSNILIRTVVHDQGKLYCWGGGGIVADSDCDAEYKESLLKVEHITGISE